MACQGSVLEGQGWWQYRTDHQFIPALGPVLVLHRITAAYYRGERASVDVLSETWSWVLSVVGWDNLTPQRHRFGIATILALLALTPGRPSVI